LKKGRKKGEKRPLLVPPESDRKKGKGEGGGKKVKGNRTTLLHLPNPGKKREREGGGGR